MHRVTTQRVMRAFVVVRYCQRKPARAVRKWHGRWAAFSCTAMRMAECEHVDWKVGHSGTMLPSAHGRAAVRNLVHASNNTIGSIRKTTISNFLRSTGGRAVYA
jgi:hypothetical protein